MGMSEPFDMLNAGFWLVVLVWMVAIGLIRAGLDEPDPEAGPA